jgi:predicted unusual protein kinase regulating ubiquinone biosynthesis (AarF/ABC1/UbiB family)
VANKLVARQNLKVDFSSETAEGLVLCPSDIDAANFMIDSNGTLFAIDFGCTGYMPPSFVSYSFMNLKPFSRMVARLIEYPIYANLSAMSVASSILVLGGNNSLGR